MIDDLLRIYLYQGYLGIDKPDNSILRFCDKRKRHCSNGVKIKSVSCSITSFESSSTRWSPTMLAPNQVTYGYQYVYRPLVYGWRAQTVAGFRVGDYAEMLIYWGTHAID
jgi:hypothetical protein